MNRKTKAILAGIGISELVGLSGSIFNIQAIPTWYVTLNKPTFSPPNWLFGPVWTILYAMMGAAFGLVGGKAKKIFYIQLGLNFLWSGLFFGLRQPGVALVEIVVLWAAIAMCIKEFMKINKTAGYLLIPYLMWVSFALVLNWAIVVLN